MADMEKPLGTHSYWHPSFDEWSRTADVQELMTRFFEVEQEHKATLAAEERPTDCDLADPEVQDDEVLVVALASPEFARQFLDARTHYLDHECERSLEVLEDWADFIAESLGGQLFGEDDD